jgi:steroid 5-alpha reductase family enzyme
MFDLSHGGIALALIAALAFLTWLASLARRDVSIVDGMWPVFIGSAGLSYAALAGDTGPASLIALALLLVWAIRLCVHLTVRNHGQPEDRRYQKIRANNQPNFELKSLYIVFGLQAALAWIVALPFMAIVRGDGFGVLALAGLALAAFGIGFEAVADWQLERFKKRGGTRGRVLDTGLWRYSRHPNYFGECCVWWGFGLVALGAGAWWALLSPLLMTFLLLKVSGVSMLEKDIGERRPEYARYVRETNAFFPGAKRGASAST